MSIAVHRQVILLILIASISQCQTKDVNHNYDLEIFGFFHDEKTKIWPSEVMIKNTYNATDPAWQPSFSWQKQDRDLSLNFLSTNQQAYLDIINKSVAEISATACIDISPEITMKPNPVLKITESHLLFSRFTGSGIGTTTLLSDFVDLQVLFSDKSIMMYTFGPMDVTTSTPIASAPIGVIHQFPLSAPVSQLCFQFRGKSNTSTDENFFSKSGAVTQMPFFKIQSIEMVNHPFDREDTTIQD